VEGRRRGRGTGERNGLNNVCTYEYMNKEKKSYFSRLLYLLRGN
jgi:hypothetical protein